jgi:hypothetical protein
MVLSEVLVSDIGVYGKKRERDIYFFQEFFLKNQEQVILRWIFIERCMINIRMRTLRKFLGTTKLKKYWKVMLILAIVAGVAGISGCIGQTPTPAKEKTDKNLWEGHAELVTPGFYLSTGAENVYTKVINKISSVDDIAKSVIPGIAEYKETQAWNSVKDSVTGSVTSTIDFGFLEQKLITSEGICGKLNDALQAVANEPTSTTKLSDAKTKAACYENYWTNVASGLTKVPNDVNYIIGLSDKIEFQLNQKIASLSGVTPTATAAATTAVATTAAVTTAVPTDPASGLPIGEAFCKAYPFWYDSDGSCPLHPGLTKADVIGKPINNFRLKKFGNADIITDDYTQLTSGDNVRKIFVSFPSKKDEKMFIIIRDSSPEDGVADCFAVDSLVC